MTWLAPPMMPIFSAICGGIGVNLRGDDSARVASFMFVRTKLWFSGMGVLFSFERYNPARLAYEIERSHFDSSQELSGLFWQNGVD